MSNDFLKYFLLPVLITFYGPCFISAQEDSISNRRKAGIDSREGLYTGKSESFYDTIRIRSTRNKWINELHNIVIRPPEKTITDTLATLRSEIEFLPYSGMIIRDIRFVKLDVFGPGIHDTTSVSPTWLEQKANQVHVKTTSRNLEQHLLFKKGDIIDPRVLSDNERLIRSLSYIQDIMIRVTPVEWMDGFADITIMIKDQWSKAFYAELSDINAGRLELFDRNILGTGNEIQNNIHWNPEKSDTWGYEAVYNNRNIMGSFIDSRVYYSNVFDLEGYGIQLNRKFFTPNTKYAGGASAYHKSALQKVWNPDSGYYSSRISYNFSDLWIGRAFKLNENADIDRNRLNLIAATRLYRENYFDRPDPAPNNYYRYHDKNVWLSTLALSSQSFFRSNLVYNYGRTEDVPIGSLLNLTFGPEFGEYGNRFYTSLSYARGNYVTNLGYLYFKIGQGGFFTPAGSFEQAVFQMKIKYFTNLFIFGQFKFRQFINFDLTRGYRRYENERITINDRYGLRGFNQENVYGRQRFVMNMETVTFSPWYIYGFRFTFFSYVDFALLGEESTNLIYEDVYSGLGIGTRIQNERLVFPTFSLRLGFYPNLKDIPLGDRIHFSGEPRLNPENFYQSHPAILEYQ